MELSNLTHPEFGQVRTTYDENGTILFCASDVAKALGYTNIRGTISRHCRGVLKRYTPTSSGEQEISYIFEPDLYRLISRSKLPIAIAFEKWIFETVIPSVRKDGFYAKNDLINDPDLLIQLGMKLKQEKQEKLVLQEEVRYLHHVVAEYQPKMTYLEKILNSHCCMNVTNIAADYGISAIKLNRILHEARVQYRCNKQWVLYQDYKKKGLTQSETIPIKNGEKSAVHTKWTQQGRLLIHNILTARGYSAET